MILDPLFVASDLMRMLNCVTCGLGSVLSDATQCVIRMLSCGLGCSCCLLISAFAWIFVHPTLAIGVMLLAVAIAFGVPLLAKSGKFANAREQDGYVKMGGIAFNTKRVQPTMYQV